MWPRPSPKIRPWVALVVALFVSQASGGLYNFDGEIEYEWEILYKADPAYISTLKAIRKDRPGPEEGHDWNFSLSETSFSCSLPIVTEPRAEKAEKKEEAQTVQQLLEPLRTECLYKVCHLFFSSCLMYFQQEGYWSYEFCYGRHMRQYRKEQDQIIHDYMLGTTSEGFLSDFLGLAPTQTQIGIEHDGYYEEAYEEGATCDLTGRRRVSMISFHCNPAQVHMIAAIKVCSI